MDYFNHHLLITNLYCKITADELGVVMGAQESVSSFARIIGPLTGGIVWTLPLIENGH